MTSFRLLLLLSMTAARCGFGSAACAECHSEIYQQQMVSRHAQTLRPFAGSRMSLALGHAVVDGGDYKYEYRGGAVHVTGRGRSIDAPLDWAFGAGSFGFTAVGTFEGRYFEHRVSWFTGPGTAAETPGQPKHGVLGVFKTPAEAYACFNCHSTSLAPGADGGPDVDSMTQGIQCERCHGPGPAHIAAARQHRATGEIAKAIFDAARLRPKASVEVCGECHRTRASLKDPVTVRFQPVGLMSSRCFLRSGQLSCVTCHDPHIDAVRNDSAFYAAKCLGCHRGSTVDGSGYHREQRGDCLSCHMRRQSLGPGLSFTDHRIRVYRGRDL